MARENDLLSMLSGGDIRSDGEANRVAEIVLENPHMLDDLIAGLDAPDDLVRGRTAHALEQIARTQPEWMLDYLAKMVDLAKHDQLAMVRWHLAMIFGDIAQFGDHVEELSDCLFVLLDDSSVFVRSWSISSLCIIARLYPGRSESITQYISQYCEDSSIAIRARVHKALKALTDPTTPLPKGWVKSERLDI